MAQKTIAAVKEALESDQGFAFRESFYKFIRELTYLPYHRKNRHNNRIGPTSLSNACDRKIWLDYRWGTDENLDVKSILIFQRGMIEEARILAALEAAGMTVNAKQPNGQPYRFNAIGDLYGGMIDGVVVGCPDVENKDEPLILEMKTANDKSFNLVKTYGLLEGKPEHYQQIQQYLHNMKDKFQRALYVMTNKNTEEWYTEVVEYNPLVAQFDTGRIERILTQNTMPPPTANQRNCAYCVHSNYCWGLRPLNYSCRTCENSIVSAEEGWECLLSEPPKPLTHQEQENGCCQRIPVARTN